METLAQILAVIAVLGTGVIYGTDMLGALVMRPTFESVDDRMMTIVAGRSHKYGDKRMPLPGAGGAIASLATTVVALFAGATGGAIAAGIATVAVLVWLGIYFRVAAPINKLQIAASESGVIPDNARELQRRWDSVVNLRAALQGIAVLGLCIALILL